MTTLTIMRQLPREVDPLVYNMTAEDPGDVSYASVGGLSEQIRELREVRSLLIRNIKYTVHFEKANPSLPNINNSILYTGY